MCTSNEADNERSELFNRLINCIDLLQIEVRYHDKCRIHPVYRQQFQVKKGRPVNDTKMYYFEKVCEFLEQNGDLYTLKEPHLKMCELAEPTDVYTVQWLKNKLKNGKHIFFGEIKDRPNVACFKDLVI